MARRTRLQCRGHWRELRSAAAARGEPIASARFRRSTARARPPAVESDAPAGSVPSARRRSRAPLRSSLTVPIHDSGPSLQPPTNLPFAKTYGTVR
eukprot:4931761-Prymnesium_polylepis.1